MNDEGEPNIVTSGKSQKVTIDDIPFAIEIYRLESDEAWTLEVVDSQGTSHVWDDPFASDSDAYRTALDALRHEGAGAFMHGHKVIPFPKR